MCVQWRLSKIVLCLLTLRKIYWIEKDRPTKLSKDTNICHTPFLGAVKQKKRKRKCDVLHYRVRWKYVHKNSGSTNIKFTNSNGKSLDRLSFENQTIERMRMDEKRRESELNIQIGFRLSLYFSLRLLQIKNTWTQYAHRIFSNKKNSMTERSE